jgi:hypothetical protein
VALLLLANNALNIDKNTELILYGIVEIMNSFRLNLSKQNADVIGIV